MESSSRRVARKCSDNHQELDHHRALNHTATGGHVLTLLDITPHRVVAR